MKETIHAYFQVGLIQWMSYPRSAPLDSLRKIASDDFFDAIELCGCKDDRTRDEARKLLEQSHLKVCYGAQPHLLGPGLNPNHLDEGERKKAEAVLLKAVDEAQYLGAKGMAFLAGKWEEETKDRNFEQLVKTTRTACSYAAGKGMSVELEVFDYNVDKAALIGPAPLAAEYAAEVRKTHNNFGLLVDLSHFPITFESSRFVMRTCRPYITHLHIGNAVVKKGAAAYGDLHPRFGFPDSANDVEQVLDFFRVAREEGFFDRDNPLVLSFEVKPWGDEDEDLVVANSKRVINRAWALLED